MPDPTSDTLERIHARISKAAPAGVWSRADFLDIGTPNAVEKALQRLTNRGEIRRPYRGLYDKPAFGFFAHYIATSAPDADVMAGCDMSLKRLDDVIHSYVVDARREERIPIRLAAAADVVRAVRDVSKRAVEVEDYLEHCFAILS